MGRPLGRALGRQKSGEVGACVAAIVARAGEKLRQVPIGGHFILTVIQVKIPAFQPGDKLAPGYGGNGEVLRAAAILAAASRLWALSEFTSSVTDTGEASEP